LRVCYVSWLHRVLKQVEALNLLAPEFGI
jgi:hypothetical protein